MSSLAEKSIHRWIIENKIKNEKGEPIDFFNHRYLFKIYSDQSQKMCVMKAAQVGMTTAEIIKNHYDAKRYKMDVIYTMPTDGDVKVMVGGKVNRIIANNPCMLEDVADKDSVEQKAVGLSMIYFRGTWTKKAAMSVTADRLSHDEKDASRLDIIADYQTRLQHSKYKQTHTYSHPSLPGTGVHIDWEESDQKHWFVKCEKCKHWQYMSWDIENPKKMSVSFEKEIFVCKKCGGEITDEDRRCGQWVAKHPGKEWSGYWIPLLIAPWVSAKDIIKIYRNKETTQEYFYTKVLGLPFADGTSKLLKEDFLKNLTGTSHAPRADERIIIGIDTGLRLDYVMGTEKGLFYQGDTDKYEELERHMERWQKAIAIIDAGGDLIGSRAFAAKYPGRVFICYLTGDKKTNELVKWGTGDEHGAVSADRNRLIQLVVGEFRDSRIKVHGNENDWYEYWLDWNNLSKMKVLDPDTNVVKGYKWIRAGRDHRALATVFWRVGMTRFSGTGSIVNANTDEKKENGYYIETDQTVQFNPEEMFDFINEESDNNDWRL